MLDLANVANHALLDEAIAGLGQTQKAISPKWFYDARGSALFEEITRLDEYYPFRAGESLHTENSHKFTREGLAVLLQATGWGLEEYWTDPAENFAVLLLRPG